jgi:hypothetical protein
MAATISIGRAVSTNGHWQGAKTGVSDYLDRMKIVLVILIALLMLATVGVLVAGLVGLARGGGDPRRSNKLMQYRVLLQAGALLLFVILLSLLRS